MRAKQPQCLVWQATIDLKSKTYLFYLTYTWAHSFTPSYTSHSFSLSELAHSRFSLPRVYPFFHLLPRNSLPAAEPDGRYSHSCNAECRGGRRGRERLTWSGARCYRFVAIQRRHGFTGPSFSELSSRLLCLPGLSD